MTPQEFKAWFDGFTEGFGNRIPTKAQWARVKERVAEIDGSPVTERVYLDRYWTGPYQYYPLTWANFSAVATGTVTSNGGAGVNCYNNLDGNNLDTASVSFNSLSAMNALGRNEAAALS